MWLRLNTLGSLRDWTNPTWTRSKLSWILKIKIQFSQPIHLNSIWSCASSISLPKNMAHKSLTSCTKPLKTISGTWQVTPSTCFWKKLFTIFGLWTFLRKTNGWETPLLNFSKAKRQPSIKFPLSSSPRESWRISGCKVLNCYARWV